MIPLLREGEGRIALEECSEVLTTLEELLTRLLPTLKLEPASLELTTEKKKRLCRGFRCVIRPEPAR